MERRILGQDSGRTTLNSFRRAEVELVIARVPR